MSHLHVFFFPPSLMANFEMAYKLPLSFKTLVFSHFSMCSYFCVVFSAVSSTRSFLEVSIVPILYLIFRFLVKVYTLFLEIIFNIFASLNFLPQILIKNYTKCFAAFFTDCWTPHMSCYLWSFHSATVARVWLQAGLPRNQNWNEDLGAGPFYEGVIFGSTPMEGREKSRIGKRKNLSYNYSPNKSSCFSQPHGEVWRWDGPF